ncbi:hypothetical protein PENTCL1PPCAC_19364, partial [Pristionchus entomophagus]
MNSSELNASVTEAIVIFHHVSGVIFFLINMIVCFLIIFDVDPRGKVYRKYLLSLQLSSMMFDLLCNIYAPILLINSRLLYADSFLAQYIDMAVLGVNLHLFCQVIDFLLFSGIINAYIACVFYRRNVKTFPRMGVTSKASYIFMIESDLFTIAGSVSTVSIVFNLITTHTFVHSLTIIACSPTYQKTIKAVIGFKVGMSIGRFS